MVFRPILRTSAGWREPKDKDEELYTGNLDLHLLEWTGRLPLRYPEHDSIPDKATIREWVVSYFKAVSEERPYTWML